FLGQGAWRKLPSICWRKEGAPRGTLDYPERGLSLDVSDGKLEGIVLFAAANARKGISPFGGRIRFGGMETDFARLATEKRILDMLGEPWWRDEDEDEVLLFYELGDVEWQVEIDKTGAVAALLVVSPPLMEDAEQRAAYGVTKPWPPEPASRTQPEE
ncbi:MAG TPA: hypothetical protein P5137_02220, partial [Candidatus Brocadiia bacterium]|nr:hypothetical protein [Candidatus Brocadiia bacterium]